MPLNDETSRWPSIDPGRMRTPIVIQSLQPSSPPSYSADGLVTSWQPLAKMMAGLDIIKGTDLIKSGQDVTKTWIVLTVRYMPGIEPQMRVQVPDYSTDPVHYHYYVIQAVENVEHRRVLLKLMCLGINEND